MSASLLLVIGTLLAQDTLALRQLDLPSAARSSECRLVPASSKDLGGGRVHVGLWDGFASNPWAGADKPALRDIRTRMYGNVPAAPDGPPLSGRDTVRFLNQLIAEVQEGYAAFYQDAKDARTIVYALRYSVATAVPDLPKGARNATAAGWFRAGNSVVVVFGDKSDCLSTVAAHVRKVMP